MLTSNIPLLMVGAFLLLTLAMGLYYTSYKKATTFREYAVGHKKFTTATLVATVLATNYGGGGLVRTVEQIHHDGLYWIIRSLLGIALPFWLLSQLALRMGPFMNNLSMAETIDQVYGKYPRVITALSGISTSIASIAIQINVMSLAINLCIDSANPRIITMCATLILILYSTFGGIRPVTFTDVLQFLTFAIIIPFLAWFMFIKAKREMLEIIPSLQKHEKFQFNCLFHFDTKLVAMFSLLLAHVTAYIEPTTMQRVYMSSGPIQAKNVFLFANFFRFLLKFFILLIGLFVFINAPELPKANIWYYIMANIPVVLKGFVCISLLAMTMSTADSQLNACAIMISHDIRETVSGVKTRSYGHQLLLAKLTTLVVGISAMVLAFFYNDLLQLLHFTFYFSVPMVAAPFILAVFGFRGTSRTALIGMATGALTILIWNQWIKPATGIDGSFFCMVANGLAMLAAHYLLPQPIGKGWIGPDDHFKQIKQAATRKRTRFKQEFKASFTKENLIKLRPNNFKLVCVGLYIIASVFLTFFTIETPKDQIYWYIIQLIIGAFFMGYAFIPQAQTSDWTVTKYWLGGLTLTLPVNIFWHFYHIINPIFTLTLSLAHLTAILIIFPLHLHIQFAVAMLLIITAYPIYYTATSILLGVHLLPLLGLSLLLFCSIVYYKLKLIAYHKQNSYLKQQRLLEQEQKLNQIAYNLKSNPSTTPDSPEQAGNILENIVGDVTQSISFLDNSPLYKQDFQSIINKFSEWATFLKKRAKFKDHMLLLPTEISIDELIHKLEIAFESETGHISRLLVEKSGSIPAKIVWDINQTIHLLTSAISLIASTDRTEASFVKIQLHTTHLKYERGEPIKNAYPPAMAFPAIAIVISCCCTPTDSLPKVQSYYEFIRNAKVPKWLNRQTVSERTNLTTKTIADITHAHYGYLHIPTLNQSSMLLVLPWNVTTIRNEMIAKLPMEHLTSETSLMPKEEHDSMIILMEFHNYVCKAPGIDPDIIAGILLLLRRCYGFKRHPSGKLFYVRTVGIAQLVTEWLFHSPKPIYASLLYDLVRYTRLPLSYIKANYNLGIFYFVQNVLNVDKHQAIAPSELYVDNRFKEAVREEQLSVLYLKLAERLYDLRHATGYANQEEVKYMAKETLTVDIELARKYLSADIATALETAAQHAWDICKKK